MSLENIHHLSHFLFPIFPAKQDKPDVNKWQDLDFLYKLGESYLFLSYNTLIHEEQERVSLKVVRIS